MIADVFDGQPRPPAITRPAALALALLLAIAGPAFAQMSTVRSLRVDWSVGQKCGRPLLQGRVYNDHAVWASNVRLLIQVLDPSGQVIGSTTAYVFGDVPPSGRAYFEAAAPPGGAAYRSEVTSFEFRGYGGGGGGM